MLCIALFALVAIWFYIRPSRADYFFSCNQHSLDSVSAEESRRDALYEGRSAMINVLNDSCMEKLGYRFTGGQDLQYCSASRIPQCYSSRWLGF